MKSKFNRFLTASITSVIALTVAAQADTAWNGSVSGSWATVGNWTPTSPVAADLVSFGAAGGAGTVVANATQTLDGSYSVKGLTIGNSNLVTINAGTGVGNVLTTGANGLLLNSGTGVGLVINADVALGANQSWITGGATNTRPITVNGAVNLGDKTLNVQPNNTNVITIAGAVTGSGNITKIQSGTLSLIGATTLTGTGDKLTISAGTVTVPNGAVVDISGGQIKSSATSAKGTLNINTGGSLTAATLFSSWGTTMALNGTLTTSGAFTFSGGTSTITGTGTAKVGTLTNTNGSTSNINGARFNIGTGGITLASGTLNLGATTIGAFANWSSSAAMGLTDTTTGTTFNTLDSGDSLTERTITLSGILSGAGIIKKSGAGVLILSGANTYSGATSVNTGTLRLGNAAALGTVAAGTTVNAGGTLDLNGQTVALLEALNLNGTGVANAGALINSSATAATYAGGVTLGTNSSVGGSGALTLSGVVSGAGTGLTKVGNGTLTLSNTNGYTGATQVDGGRLSLTGSLTSAVTVGGGVVSGAGSTTGSLTMNGGAISLAGGATTTSLTANGVIFSVPTTIVFRAVPEAATTYDVVTYGAGGVTNFANLAPGSRGTLTDDTTNQKITFTAGTSAARTWNTTSGVWDNLTTPNFAEDDLKFSAGDTVTFGEPASASVVTLAGKLLPGSVTVNNSTNDITFTGVNGVNEISGAGALVKNGTGALTITTAQTYTGGTTLNLGTLRVGANALGSGAFALNGGRLSSDSINARSFSNAVTIGGDISLGDVTDYGGLTFSGAVDLSGATRQVTTDAAVLMSGAITNGGLTKAGLGMLSFSTTKAYTGGTTITGGTLELIGGGGSGGTIRGAVTVNTGGTLRLGIVDALGYNNDATAVNTVNLVGGTLTSAVGTNQTTTAKFYLTGGTINGAVNLDLYSNNSSVTTYASPDESTISLATMNLRQDNTVFDIADGLAANDLLISAKIGNGAQGNHAMIKDGGGTMKLTAFNVFTGNVTVNAGTLDLTSGGIYTGGHNSTNIVTVNTGGLLKVNSLGYSATASLGQLSDYAQFRVINGGTLEVTGSTQGTGNDFTVGVNGGTFRYNPAVATNTLTLSGNINTNIPIAGALTFRADGNITVDEIIEGAGSLIKTGVGTLSLGAVNTYAGTTTVDKGKLHLGTSLASSSVTINTEGSVQAGTVKASGISTIPALTMNGGGMTARASYPGGDKIVVGALTLESPTVVTIIPAGGLLPSDRIPLIDYTGTISGAAGFAGLTTITPVNPHYSFALVPGSVANAGEDDDMVVLEVTSAEGITWFGDVSDVWDAGASGVQNWQLASSASTPFYNYDMVTFDNSGVTTRPVVTLTGTITPASVEVKNDTGTYTFQGAPLSGSTSLTKYGAGGLTLAAANTHTGQTKLEFGTLNINHAQALGTGAFTVTGGTIDNTTAGALTLTSGNVKNLNGSFTFTGTQDLNLGTGAVTLAGSPAITVAAKTLTVDGAIGGTGFTKAGAGTMVLNGANNYVGTTTVSGGTLEVKNNSGAKMYSVAAGATLKMGYSNGNTDYNYGITVNGNGVADASGLYIEGGRSLVLQNTLTLSTAPSTVRAYGTGTATLRGWDVNYTHLTVNSAASGSIIDAGVSLLSASYGYRMNVASGAATATGDLVINGPMSGTSNAGFANFRKEGTGSMLINTAATYAAGMDIRNGSVVLGGNDRLPVASYVTLGEGANSGKLVLNGYSQTLTSVTAVGTGTKSVVGGSSTLSTLTINNAAAVAFSGKLGGAGTNENNLALVKTGVETLTLSGVNTYTGNTTVSAGILNLASTGALRFVVGNAGATNSVGGVGTASFDGTFNIDTSAVSASAGTWNLVTVASKSFSATFSVSGFTDPEDDGIWTKADVGGKTWSFSEGTGTLTLQTAGYDAWAAQIADVGQRGRGQDPDGDGFTNLQEFLFGTSPNEGNGSLTTTEKTGGDLIIRWKQRTSNATYQLKESTTLSAWTNSGAAVTDDGAAVGDYQPKMATITIGAGKDFFRVEGTEN